MENQMLKYDQFESKKNSIKKQRRLKKLKKNDGTHMRQEIQAKNVQLNGPSGFSKDFHNLYEKNHLKMEVKLTPEWVLDKMSTSRYADGHGVIYFYADEDNCHWIELAITTLEVPFVREEIVLDCCTTVISFALFLDSLMDQCPSLFHEMWDLNLIECVEEKPINTLK